MAGAHFGAPVFGLEASSLGLGDAVLPPGGISTANEERQQCFGVWRSSWMKVGVVLRGP